MPSKYSKDYYEKNKELIKQRNKEYAKTHKQIVPKHDKYFDEVTKNTNDRHNKHWATKEKDYLKEYYGIMATKILAKKLKRSITAIEKQASEIGINRTSNFYDYTKVSDLVYLFIPTFYMNRVQAIKNLHTKLAKYFIVKKINSVYFISNSDAEIIKNFMGKHTLLYKITKTVSRDILLIRAKKLNILINFLGSNFIKNSDIPKLIDIIKYSTVRTNEIKIIKDNINMSAKYLQKKLRNRTINSINSIRYKIKKGIY